MEHRKKKSYELSFKLKAIESAGKMSKESAACEFKVDPRRICELCTGISACINYTNNNYLRSRFNAWVQRALKEINARACIQENMVHVSPRRDD